MSIRFNIRHLEEKSRLLKGDLPVSELDLAGVDELIHLSQPLSYDLEVQLLEKSVLVQGTLSLRLVCECARCLKPYSHELSLEGWALHLALEGDEKVAINNDYVDLTPYVREDILLAFPQHPLCESECKGLAIGRSDPKKPGTGRGPEPGAAVWAELNKLKL